MQPFSLFSSVMEIQKLESHCLVRANVAVSPVRGKSATPTGPGSRGTAVTAMVSFRAEAVDHCSRQDVQRRERLRDLGGRSSEAIGGDVM